MDHDVNRRFSILAGSGNGVITYGVRNDRALYRSGNTFFSGSDDCVFIRFGIAGQGNGLGGSCGVRVRIAGFNKSYIRINEQAVPCNAYFLLCADSSFAESIIFNTRTSQKRVVCCCIKSLQLFCIRISRFRNRTQKLIFVERIILNLNVSDLYFISIIRNDGIKDILLQSGKIIGA